MARKPRVEPPGATHHVVTKGIAGHELFRDDVDRRSLVLRLARTVERHGWSCLAYCLLDTHVHLVVETPESNLSAGMKWLKASYAQDFNYRHNRQGPVFGGRFYSRVVDSDAYLVAVIVYVLLNPVRARVVDRAEQWPWSSYLPTLGLASVPPFLDAGRVLGLVDSRPDVARRRLAAAVLETAQRDRPAPPDMGSDPWGLTPCLPQTRGV